MQYPELPVFAFVSAVLVLIPLIWHWRSRNVAILAMIFWLSIVDIIYGVNAIVWAGNVGNPIPVWCDITSKFTVGASYALPIATLCICKHLEMVSSSRKVSFDNKDRQRRMIFEGVMCFFVPMIFMALHYIVQGHRYDIFENVGCQAAVYISVQAIFIIWFPQLLFSVIALIYAAFALHNFVRRRLTFAAHLQNSNSALTTNRYLRLIAMSLTEMVWGTSLTAYNLWSNASPGLRPWTNWADVHSNFSRVDLFPTDGIPPEFIRTMMLFWWTLPASSLIFFVFFGFGEEAMKEYRKMWTWFKKTVLRKRDEEKKGSLFGTSPSSRGPRALNLVSLKTISSTLSSSPVSPSHDYHAKSPQSMSSHLSQSTITLAASPDGSAHKKSKSAEAHEDAESHYTCETAPGYYAPYPTSYPDIGVAIDATREATTVQHRDTRRPSLPELDTSDTFTISTFSYYGQPSSPSGTTPPSPAPSTFPPHTPTYVPQSLPPPPRRGPRHAGSNGSVSAASIVPGVPEDVGPASYEERRILGIPGGGIMVTIQRQASVDEMV
ncbi:pheromone A receptor-domain-containing protein [Flammula alnicola]|nr:pheromone A receptor-domain-containing protein [Flammula alnicola]